MFKAQGTLLIAEFESWKTRNSLGDTQYNSTAYLYKSSFFNKLHTHTVDKA